MDERRPVSERTFSLLVLVASVFVASTVTSRAEAQEWLKDRMYQEGQGVRTGDVEWHPGIAIEGGYDSNYFLRSSTNGVSNGCKEACPQGSPEMRITPSLSLATIGPIRHEGETNREPPSIDFRLNASGTY